MENYIKKAGKLFNIITVDTIRDGGTKILKTTVNEIVYYVHKDDKTLHTEYPPTEDNKVIDNSELNYIKDRLQTYTERLLEDYNRVAILNNTIQEL